MAEWFRTEDLDDAFAWTNLGDPLHEAEADFHERLRAFTGIDAGVLRTWTATATDAELRRNLGIPEGSDDPSESVITQVLRDLPPTTPDSVRREEVWRLDERTRRVTPLAGELEGLRAAARDAARAGGVPEKSGQLAACGRGGPAPLPRLRRGRRPGRIVRFRKEKNAWQRSRRR